MVFKYHNINITQVQFNNIYRVFNNDGTSKFSVEGTKEDKTQKLKIKEINVRANR